MTLREEEPAPGTRVLTLAGEADLAAVPELRRALNAARSLATQRLVIDFGGVTFVNTPVWAQLIEYYQWAGKTGGRIVLCGLHGRALASFEVVQLGAFLPHVATREAALDFAG